MPLPFILSPYLRPLRREGRLLIDNGLTGRLEPLGPLDERVVSALWIEATAEEELARLAADLGERGEPELLQSLARLQSTAMLFPDREACERALNGRLDLTTEGLPFIDQIELTNHCPMRCGFCPRGIPGKMARPLGFLDLGLYRRLLDQLHPRQARYRPLELHHLGESLLHPQVDLFVAEATTRGLPTEMSVNPSLLTPALSRRLLAAGIRRLVISLDGMDDQTLVAIRGPSPDTARPSAPGELLVPGRRPARPPAVVIQMIDLNENRLPAESFLAALGRLRPADRAGLHQGPGRR